jgi:probable phosphoglycerate mutase
MFMKLLLVRHGHPNYELDCLTPLGHLQAEAAAKRLKDEKIDLFYSSTCGRAVETAEHVAAQYGAEVTQLEFMREVIWGYNDDPHDPAGHPWNLVDQMILEGKTLGNSDWREIPPFLGNRVAENADMIAEAFDAWMEQLGYTREGEYYRCGVGTEKTVALFSHGGSSNAVLAHLLNLPFPYVIQVFRANYTSVTVVTFPDTPGKLVMPVLELVNDARHIENLKAEAFYGN